MLPIILPIKSVWVRFVEAVFNPSNLKMFKCVSRLIKMDGYWVIGICAFTFDVGSVSSHAVLDFFTCFPYILDAAESAFYQVNDIDGGTGDIFPSKTQCESKARLPGCFTNCLIYIILCISPEDPTSMCDITAISLRNCFWTFCLIWLLFCEISRVCDGLLCLEPSSNLLTAKFMDS